MTSNINSLAKIPLTNLAPEHLSIFEQVLSRILDAPLAQLTYAQIVDGLPVRDVWNAYESRRDDIETHLEPCSESLEVWRAFRHGFQHHILQFDVNLVQGYQNCSSGTKSFNVRLLEMVAVACHDIAALLSKTAEGGVGKHPPKPNPFAGSDYESPFPPIPTDFYHLEYLDWEQYPQGVADIVGYWAEFELFGGVVLFDRGSVGNECKDAFIHPGGSFKIFQLLDQQLEAFANLAAPSSEAQIIQLLPLLPFKADRHARRVAEDESMSLHIYRNTWERKEKINTSGRVPHPRVRQEDGPVILDLLDILKANDWKLPDYQDNP